MRRRGWGSAPEGLLFKPVFSDQRLLNKMSNKYGIRYLRVNEFVRYCADLNVRTDSRQLEHYGSAGVMLPVARVIYFEDYVRLTSLSSLGAGSEPPRIIEEWPELERLADRPRIPPEDYANLQDKSWLTLSIVKWGKIPI
jgi:hypothetical protein